ELVVNSLVDEEFRRDADDFPAARAHRIGQMGHQADAVAAVDELPFISSNRAAELDRGVNVHAVNGAARRTIDSDGFYRLHRCCVPDMVTEVTRPLSGCATLV